MPNLDRSGVSIRLQLAGQLERLWNDLDEADPTRVERNFAAVMHS
jgi:hypothetical protein